MKRQGNKDKEAFRRTPEWKNFRKQLLEQRGPYCECCGVKSKRLNLHHIDEKNYTDLNPVKFVFLCKRCHDCVSFLECIKKENWCKYNPMWVDFFKRFLI